MAAKRGSEHPISKALIFFLEATNELKKYCKVCTAGISQTARIAEAIELIDGIFMRERGSGLADDAAIFGIIVKDAKPLEAFAKLESSKHFPYLTSLAVMRLWGILETSVEDLLLAAFRNYPSVRESPALKKVKLPVVDLIGLSQDDLLELLFRHYQLETKAELKPGIGRFEALFDDLGLKGAVDPEIRQTFVEFNAVRNLIAHRSSVIDARFKERCPWHEGAVNSKLELTANHFFAYEFAAYWYILEIISRLPILDGEPYSNENCEVKAKLVRDVKAIREGTRTWIAEGMPRVSRHNVEES